jgi:hypothetical protein
MQELIDQLKALPQTDCKTVHHFSAGVYARQMELPANNMAVTHAHNYDHLSILAKGKVIVKVEDKETIYEAPACITIKAFLHHSILAITDSIWFCIHATDETDLEKLDHVMIKENN